MLEHFEILDRYIYLHKHYLIGEISRIIVDIVGFNTEIVFSKPIKEYDKIRIESFRGITLHYNLEMGGEGWIELNEFFDISVIYDILSELRICAAENL